MGKRALGAACILAFAVAATSLGLGKAAMDRCDPPSNRGPSFCEAQAVEEERMAWIAGLAGVVFAILWARPSGKPWFDGWGLGRFFLALGCALAAFLTLWFYLQGQAQVAACDIERGDGWCGFEALDENAFMLGSVALAVVLGVILAFTGRTDPPAP